MTRVFLFSQTSKLILLLCECTTKKKSYLLLENKTKTHNLSVVFE